MRNPLSLQSGSVSLLFLSLVPVALSLPVDNDKGHFQNHDFQDQNLHNWPPSSLQSVVTQQGPNFPQHQLPQQHLSSFGDAPQLAHVSAVPAMHSRASNEGASSSGKNYRRRRFHYVKEADIFDQINKKEFEGKLIRASGRQPRKPRRLRSSITLVPQVLEKGADVISEVQMSIHHGTKKWAEKNQEVFAGIDPAGKKFYNFWGIPEHPETGSPKTILHYGMGYIDPSHIQARNRQIEMKVLQGAEAAAHLH
ncbi:uncharacterized protein UHOD_13170 [Ustilago sp. UG-2017b]|nr:uncharacterized protein UHOD_13170 [Ustilago sp. UG-2017b]